MKHNYFIYLISCFCATIQIVNAQVTTQIIQPNSLQKYVKFHSNKRPTVVEMAFVDVAKFQAEDAKNSSKELPPRYGVPIEVNLGLENGDWEVSPTAGGMIWKLAVKSNGATTLNIFFDRFHLPEGAILYAYNADKTYLFGPVTSVANNKNNNLATSLLKGDIMILELFEPINRKGKTELHISHVVHGYIDLSLKGNPPGSSGTIGTCNNDVACTEGDNFQSEVDAVAMIFSPIFGRGCSGTLLNNGCNNLRTNFLTAFHCIDLSQDGEISTSEAATTQNFLFSFNYKASSCGGSENNMSVSFTGADLISTFNQTDFALLRLSQSPITGSGIRFAGWDRSGTTPPTTAGIHHPNGNVMKISLDDNQPGITTYLRGPGLANSYWRILWDDGSTEPGSSGSGLFNNQNRVIGQLRGGFASCTNTDSADYYGRLSMSWNGGGTSDTRLSDHLSDDPSVMTTNTIAIPSIGIPDQLCLNSSVSYNNIPPNMQIVGGNILGAYLTNWGTIQPQSGFTGEGFFELQLTPIGITCNDPLILRKTFNVGIATPEVQLYHNWDCSGWVYVTNVIPGTTYNWTVSYNGQTYYSQGTSVYLPQSSTGNVYYYLEASNACNSTWVEGYRQLQGCGSPYSLKPADTNTAKNYDWKMQLSPNPATNDLNISLSDYNERQLHTLGDVKIFNMTGQVVYQSKQILDNTMRMNIQNLTNGFYIMEIRGEGFSTRQRFNVSR